MPRPYLIIGNPENRRVTLFQEALAAMGHGPATVVSWQALTRDVAALERVALGECFVRLDAWGENFEVERQLLHRGRARAEALKATVLSRTQVDELVDERGRILAPRQAHEGFLEVLADVHAVIASRPGWRALNGQQATVDLFDKRLTSINYQAAGVPVADPLYTGASGEALLSAIQQVGWAETFVKVSCASSASCLALVTQHERSFRLLTSMELAQGKRFNNLRVSTYRREAQVLDVLDFLTREGAHVERSIPKPRLGGEFFDLRVLCIAGEPRFIVVRQNSIPITNLHLGGRRGELDAVRALCPAEAWEAAMDSCRRAAATHDTLHVGLDVAFDEGFTRHVVLEGNAFGDLLPNLRVNGQSVYEAEIEAAEQWSCES